MSSSHPLRPGARQRAARQHGFTLIEVMIVVVIIGILAAIAYPSYQEHVRRGHRAEAQRGLMEAAQFMQRFYAANMRYDCVLGNASCAAGSDDAVALPSGLATIQSGRTTVYEIEVDADASSFTLTATPKGMMAADRCGNLTLTESGIKGTSADTVANCWK